MKTTGSGAGCFILLESTLLNGHSNGLAGLGAFSRGARAGPYLVIVGAPEHELLCGSGNAARNSEGHPWLVRGNRHRVDLVQHVTRPSGRQAWHVTEDAGPWRRITR